MHKRNSSAFTIVELLIVIVVIAVLAAIIIVSYTGITDQAKRSTAVADLGQFVQKIATYKTLNNDALPSQFSDLGVATPSGNTYNYYRYDNNSQYCLSVTTNGVSYYINSTNPSVVGQYSCTDPQSIDGATGFLSLSNVPGATAYFTNSISGVYSITLYSVVQVNDTSVSYATAASLTPSSSPGSLRFQTGDVGSSSLGIRGDTSVVTNQTAYQSSRTAGLHIQWALVDAGAQTLSFAADKTAINSTKTGFDVGTGWGFTGLALSSSNASQTPIAAIVFSGAQDQTTRGRVMQWLSYKYSLGMTF